MIERNQEDATHLDALSNALLSKQSVEEAVDWFKPRDSGLHLYHNNVMGVGLHRTDNGIQLVSLFDLKRGVELLNRSRPDADRADQQKTSLAAYAVQIIKSDEKQDGDEKAEYSREHKPAR